ncbi:MAG TPA: flavodoxin domain-containing protein [Gaiellaceae bacterium]|nr:flavodoxin domain-containing protein [Gaiellaceae bacterium]
MADTVLIAYASKHGSTLEVAEAIDAVLRGAGIPTALREASRVHGLSDYGAVVLGAPIYMTRWHRDAHRFLRRNEQELAAKPLAVFALGPLHEDETEWAKARSVVSAALEGHAFTPVSVEVFGGKVDPDELRFPFSKMPKEDARDWKAIEAWAAGLAVVLAPPVPV